MDNDLEPIRSMLDSFMKSGQATDLRETYFKNIAIPAMKKVNSEWHPKTIQEACIILKKHLNKEKIEKPNFFVDID
tara:strand:- start:826 stop:1053 length:228 start_codon:yes stop_codon:yes gene_type:complete